jgi:uncharacterized membrane protein YraQ (UPF0718 family)
MNIIIKFYKKNWVLFLILFVYLIIYFGKDKIGFYLSSEDFQMILGQSIYYGWMGLSEYFSGHVLFCLVPAFFIAGAVNTLIDSKSIFKYLSGKTNKVLSYLIASIGGFFIEVCSCTILPLFAGIWKRGAGIGIATTFLYAGPAINIIAFLLTGQKLGWDIGIARLVLSISFSIIIGLIMEIVFKNEKQERGELTFAESKNASLKGRKGIVFWILLISTLVIGTAPIMNKMVYIVILVLLIVIFTFLWLKPLERSNWWNETIKFATNIIPLLILGIFLSSSISNLIPKEEFQKLVGHNSVFTNLIAVAFGSIAYFPALVEVPIAENFLRLGMSKGPLLAYLLADPVLSLQSLLVINKFIGIKKTLVYVVSIVVLTTFAGFLFGSVL